MKIINLTPHVVRTRDGGVYPSMGVARVSTKFVKKTRINEEVLYDRQDELYLPAPEEGVYYIVSAISLAIAKNKGRTDCISPAVFHPRARRNNFGRVDMVPGFIY